MRWNKLENEACSVARTVSVIGDRWTLLILRDCFLRVRRFEEFQARLGVARALLARRPRTPLRELPGAPRGDAADPARSATQAGEGLRAGQGALPGAAPALRVPAD